MRVLLIEDDPSLCRFFTRALGRAGYEVDTQNRGDGGLRAIRENPPDCLLLDWFLPGMDGVSVLRSLRAEGFAFPVLVLSGSDESARRLALDAGANAFLPKPCGLVELTDAVAAVMNRESASLAAA